MGEHWSRADTTFENSKQVLNEMIYRQAEGGPLLGGQLAKVLRQSRRRPRPRLLATPMSGRRSGRTPEPSTHP